MRIVLRLVACHAMRALVWPSVVALRLLLHPRFGDGLSFGGCGAQLAAEILLAARGRRRRRQGRRLEEELWDRRLARLEDRHAMLADALMSAFGRAGAAFPAELRPRHLRVVPPDGRLTGPQRLLSRGFVATPPQFVRQALGGVAERVGLGPGALSPGGGERGGAVEEVADGAGGELVALFQSGDGRPLEVEVLAAGGLYVADGPVLEAALGDEELPVAVPGVDLDTAPYEELAEEFRGGLFLPGHTRGLSHDSI